VDLSFIYEEQILGIISLLTSQIKKILISRAKIRKMEIELNRILHSVKNEAYYNTLSKLVESGALAKQLIAYAKDLSQNVPSIDKRAREIAVSSRADIADQSSVENVVKNIAWAFFNIVNEPESTDAKAIINHIHQGDEALQEKMQHLDKMIGKVLTLSERIAINTSLSSTSDTIKVSESIPVINNLRFRNVYFTGKDGVLAEIHNAFESGNTISLTQVITGLGGIGKTQAALEYAFRYGSKYKVIWWVSAETEATILNSYKHFSDKLQLSNGQQQDSDAIMNSVIAWMDTHEKWLFIYDNLDTLTIDNRWWPRNNRGNILITTRNKQIALGRRIDVSVFSEDEAVSYLEKRTGIHNDRANAIQLAKRLGYFPLALLQAASFIYNGSTFMDYLKLLEKYGTNLLNEIEDGLDYTLSVTATWKISFSMIDTEAARQLLYLCANLASEGIPPSLFSENAELLPQPLQDHIIDELSAYKVWGQLTKYSLLEKQGVEQSYSMHRLLQEVIWNKLCSEPQWAKCCLSIFGKIYTFEYGNTNSHNQFIKLTPHVEALLTTARMLLLEDASQKDIAALYIVGGLGQSYLGNYSQALEWYQKAMAIHEKVLGKEHPDTATTYNNIASVYYSQGDYAKSSEWDQKVLLIREKVLGKEHPGTATTYNNIAGVYAHQGNYPEALEWYQKALVNREKVLGKEHPGTATTYNNIGGVYDSQGNYPKALEWYQKALVIREKVLGKEHPDTATSYLSIAGVYVSQGNYPKALEWYQKALVICEKVLGKEHPDTANTYNNIALVYDSQGDYPKALEWYQKALVIREKVLGKEHPDTATTYNNIALVNAKQGNYPKALEWYQKALVIREKVLGKEHPDTATTYNNIAVVYDGQGDYPKALEGYLKALAIREKVLSKMHPFIATTYNNIAGVYAHQGNYPKALEWYQKALVIHERVLGKEHPSTSTTNNNIAWVYDSQGDYPKALEWYQKALVIREKVLGKEHPDTATTYNNIAGVYAHQGNYPKALEWYQKALPILESRLGSDHPYTKSVLESIHNLQK
jgi:tetratricopeptide (TPR) repeat protein